MALPPGRLVCVRHGECAWDLAGGRYAGWEDVELTSRGYEQARAVGRSLRRADLKFNVVFTSKLRRSVATAWVACDLSENYAMPIVNTWRLNERHYGALQGLTEAEAAVSFSEAQAAVSRRRCYDAAPPRVVEGNKRHPSQSELYKAVPPAALPAGESLSDVLARVLPCWDDQLGPVLQSGATVLVVAHEDLLRALCGHVEGLSKAAVEGLNVPAGSALVYELDSDLNVLRKECLQSEVPKAPSVPASPSRVCIDLGSGPAKPVRKAPSSLGDSGDEEGQTKPSSRRPRAASFGSVDSSSVWDSPLASKQQARSGQSSRTNSRPGSRRANAGRTTRRASLKRQTRGSVCIQEAMRQFASRTNWGLIVIGAGPAGLRAAEEAASRGAKVALIEPKDIVTGAPTGAHSKILREAAIKGAKTWDEVMQLYDRTVHNAETEAIRTLKTFHIEWLQGEGTLSGEKTVMYKTEEGVVTELTADAIIIATGSKANRFPPTRFDLPGVYDSDTIWEIDRIPEFLVVQGAGLISVEYALIFAKLGSKVLVVDAFTQFLPMIDSALQDACREELRMEGVEVVMGAPFQSVEPLPESTPEAPRIRIEFNGRVVECDTLLSACGRSGNTGNLGLENVAGIKVNPRGKLIEVNDVCYTGVGRIYAVGDCATGSMGLATMGVHQATCAARHIFSSSGMMAKETGQAYKPFVAWTIPEIAWAGSTEEALKSKGVNYGTSTVQFKHTIKGCVTNDDGFLKLLFDKDSGLTLGVHICGKDACELINYGAEAMNNGTTIFEMLRFVFPAVTYHNLYNRAATDAKLRFQGASDFRASTAWKRVQNLLRKGLCDDKKCVPLRAALRHAFEYFDVNADGRLTEDELRAAIVKLGLDKEMAGADLKSMIQEATGDSNVLDISYEVFQRALSLGNKSRMESKDEVVTNGHANSIESAEFIGRVLGLAKGAYDLVVLGGGPAGLRAAEEAASRGARVAVVDPKPALSGAPTGAHSKCLREAVLKGAKTWEEVSHVLSRTIKNAETKAASSVHTFHIEFLRGWGSILDENRLQFTPVEDDAETNATGASRELATGAIIIATGSKANRFPPTKFDLPGVYDSDTISTISRIPRNLVVQGAGIVSVEYALIFAKLGSKVTVVDAFNDFLPMIDSHLQDICLQTLKENGVEVIMGTPFTSVDAIEGSCPENPGIRVAFGYQVVECDCLLSACGRHGNTQNLGLERLEGLKINPRGKLIEVDSCCYTGVGKVYAVGDCATGSMGLATTGMDQATCAARALFSCSGLMEKEATMKAKPFAVWTVPEIAWAGITEQQAIKTGVAYETVTSEYQKCLKGCLKDEAGFIKLLYSSESGVVLGVHLCGDNACELVNFGAEAVDSGMTIFEILQYVFPAVTYGYLYHRSAVEGKLRYQGIQNVHAAAAWKRVASMVREAIEKSGKRMTASEAMRKAFRLFDTDGTGFIDARGLIQSMHNLGVEIEQTEAEDMIFEATGDEDVDEIDYETFCRILR
eukprot:TRINITY_DN10705_c1_g2_i2.p1 TRINITY_DN10705_c1_g2~~TRINITY_DN10705_c1_g2_i2.p1  ORF type:complete len:1548 (-),score=352.87 TRINITY_DN10705_c1_g2_i2:71-4570(-)